MFRDANEIIRGQAGKLEFRAADRVPFLCECADPSCTDVIRLTLEDYEAVRASSHTFAIVPGHEAAESETVVDVGSDDDGVAVVAKKPPGHEITEQTDPRR
jgi:hypothetical protein